MNSLPKISYLIALVADSIRHGTDGVTAADLHDEYDAGHDLAHIQKALDRLTQAGIILRDGDRYCFRDRFTSEQRDLIREAQAKLNAETGGYDSTFHRWEAEQDAREGV